jgi:hypothetical protein
VTSWGVNIGAFIASTPAGRSVGMPAASATRPGKRNDAGRPSGPVLTGRTLDELAALIEEQQHSEHCCWSDGDPSAHALTGR